jgi:pyruvate, water dikinase
MELSSDVGIPIKPTTLGPVGRAETSRNESNQVMAKDTHVLEDSLTRQGPLVVTGRSVGTKIAAGPARVIAGSTDLEAFSDGDVLVSDTTSPDWEPVMKRAAAVVTNRGGRTCHAAIVARELGIPAVVGAQGATESIATGDPVTVSCAEGDVGKVYRAPFPSKSIGSTWTRSAGPTPRS